MTQQAPIAQFTDSPASRPVVQSANGLRVSMTGHHLIQVGALGQVGRFTSVDSVRYPRRTRVIVRTTRGLEIGEVLASPADDVLRAERDGAILRRMTVEDELLAVRLEKNRNEAYRACTGLLEERSLQAMLVDAEYLFDGSCLYFYFLGEVSSEVEALTSQLAEAYEAKVQLHKFAETLMEGCGPGCGTDAASGGLSCGSCSTGCAVAGVCNAK